MDKGITTHQKAWQYIRALNASDERLGAVAFVDEDRNYTYRQLFDQCDRYARAFGGLGITQAVNSRMGIVATMSVKDVFAFFALNMLGVSVSFVLYEDYMVLKNLFKTIQKEGITDLLLPDTVIRPDVLHKLMKRRKDLGLRNVIVMRTSKQTPCPNKRAKQSFKQNLKELRDIKGVRYMKDLLRAYDCAPIPYGNANNDQAAAIVHTSGTTKGVHKPIPLSDVALNTTAARMLSDNRFLSFRGNAVVCWSGHMSSSINLINQVFCPLAFGCTLRISHGIMDMVVADGGLFHVKDWKIKVIFCVLPIFDLLKSYPDSDSLDFSSVEMVIFGGTNVALDQLREARDFIREHNGNPLIVSGYGLSECGAANIVAVYEDDMSEDQGLGTPLGGVQVRVRDDQTGEFYSIDDGEHTGTLYLSSDSNSSGRIDDTVFFEQEIIDGAPYICTHDLVRMGKSGNLYFIGRGNRFYVNNDGLRFDAGVVEAALLNQKGIAETAAVAAYEKMILHDTVPILYVRVSDEARIRNPANVVQRALRKIYVEDDAVMGSRLPWMCVITDKLPHNASGKVDVAQIQIRAPRGKVYSVVGFEKDGRLTDLRLVPENKSKVSSDTLSPMGIPKKQRKQLRKLLQATIKTFGPDYAAEFIRLYGDVLLSAAESQGLSPFMTKEQERWGMYAPEPMNRTMRFLFHAVDTDHYYEE